MVTICQPYSGWMVVNASLHTWTNEVKSQVVVLGSHRAVASRN